MTIQCRKCKNAEQIPDSIMVTCGIPRYLGMKVSKYADVDRDMCEVDRYEDDI